LSHLYKYSKFLGKIKKEIFVSKIEIYNNNFDGEKQRGKNAYSCTFISSLAKSSNKTIT
jgi:hypothetical protein